MIQDSAYEDSSPVGTVTVSVAEDVKPPSGLVVKTSPPGRVTTVGSTGRENWRLKDWMSIGRFQRAH